MYLMDTSLRLYMRWKQDGRDGILAGSSPLYTHIYVTTVYVSGRYILLITHTHKILSIKKNKNRRLRKFTKA